MPGSRECPRCGAVLIGVRTYCADCDKVINARIKRWALGSRDQLVREFAEEVGLSEDAVHQRIKRMGLSWQGGPGRRDRHKEQAAGKPR